MEKKNADKIEKTEKSKVKERKKISPVKWIGDKAYQIKAAMTQEATNDLDNYKLRKRRRKYRRRLAGFLVVLIVLILAGVTKYVMDHHTYSEYKVESVSEKRDAGVFQFEEMGGKVLRYSSDGAMLASTAEETIWTDAYQMSQPVAEISGSVAVIYDLKGTQVVVYNSNGKMGTFQTEYPIMKASVSAKGEVAAILENGEVTLINYYTSSGSKIATSSSNMRNPGYPVDLAVSEDGLTVAVTYFVTDEDTISSYLAFYNFGDAGKKKEDNLLAGYRIAGVLVPAVEYLDNDTLIAYREDGFSVYEGSREPKETENITFEEDIVSSFGNDKYIGFVFRNSNSENMFSMKVYNISGKLKMETEFDILYENIKFSGNQIIINNSTQMAVYNLKGIEKFNGNIEEGNIFEVVKVGKTRYTVAYNGGIMTIKLK